MNNPLRIWVMIGMVQLLAACQSSEPDDHWEWWYSMSGQAQLIDQKGKAHTVWLHQWDLSHREGSSFDLGKEKELSFSLLALNSFNEVQVAGQGRVTIGASLVPGSIAIQSTSLSMGEPLPEFDGLGNICKGCSLRVEQIQGDVAEEPSVIIFGDHVLGQRARLSLSISMIRDLDTVQLYAGQVDLATGWRHAPQPYTDNTTAFRYNEDAAP